MELIELLNEWLKFVNLYKQNCSNPTPSIRKLNTKINKFGDIFLALREPPAKATRVRDYASVSKGIQRVNDAAREVGREMMKKCKGFKHPLPVPVIDFTYGAKSRHLCRGKSLPKRLEKFVLSRRYAKSTKHLYCNEDSSDDKTLASEYKVMNDEHYTIVQDGPWLLLLSHVQQPKKEIVPSSSSMTTGFVKTMMGYFLSAVREIMGFLQSVTVNTIALMLINAVLLPLEYALLSILGAKTTNAGTITSILGTSTLFFAGFAGYSGMDIIRGFVKGVRSHKKKVIALLAILTMCAVISGYKTENATMKSMKTVIDAVVGKMPKSIQTAFRSVANYLGGNEGAIPDALKPVVRENVLWTKSTLKMKMTAAETLEDDVTNFEKLLNVIIASGKKKGDVATKFMNKKFREFASILHPDKLKNASSAVKQFANQTTLFDTWNKYKASIAA